MRDIKLKIERDLSENIRNTSISGVKFSWYLIKEVNLPLLISGILLALGVVFLPIGKITRFLLKDSVPPEEGGSAVPCSDVRQT